MTFEEAVKKYVQDLLTSRLMTADASDVDIVALTEAWVMLKHTKEALEDRLKELREVLLERAGEYGMDTDKGGQLLKVGGSKVLRERREAAMPSEKDIRKLLKEHDIAASEVLTKKTTMALDASKVRALIDLGKLPEAEVVALRKVTWALRVKESPRLAGELEALVGRGEDELLAREPRDKRDEAVGPRKGAQS
jgi:hypothetical protein